MKITQIRPEFVEYIPERLEEGVLYISERYRTAVHKCCCGCGQEVVTPLSPAEWRLRRNGNRVSLWPSIGNWSYPCRSHYVIRGGRVLEAKVLTERQIQQGKVNDRADVAAQIRRANYAKQRAAPVPSQNAQAAPTHEGPPNASWLQHLIRWWKSI